ncbi:MAG: NAD-dependent epimerase/dehydratase family protein [Pseudomonadota bacterium]
MRIFVSGSTSHLARALLPRLCNDPAIESVLGLDIQPGWFEHPKYRHIQADLRDANLGPLLQGCDGLAHLAFVVLRGKTPVHMMRAINLEASQRLIAMGHSAGIERQVHLSSAAVYGGGMHIDETAPLRPIPGFLYGEHKAELEHWLTAHYPDVVRLRPHIILGPHAQPLLHTLLHQPFYVRLPDPQPLLQCVHEDDVAAAIVLALKQPATGTYNLAAHDSFSFRDAIRTRHRMAVPIAPKLASATLKLAWRMTGAGGEPGWMAGVHQSLTLNCSRALDELGWSPLHTSWDMLMR